MLKNQVKFLNPKNLDKMRILQKVLAYIFYFFYNNGYFIKSFLTELFITTQQDKMRIKRIIGELCILKNRVSGSKNEHKAAEHIYQIMRNIGLVAKIEEFNSQQSMTWELISIMAFFIVEVVFYFFLPILSLVAGLIGMVLFWGYFTTRFKPLASLFRHSISRNVIGCLKNSNAAYKIIFTAHYDTARAGSLWNPKTVANFRSNFLIVFLTLILLQILTILKLFAIDVFIFKLIMIIIGIYVLGNIIMLLISGLKGEQVQGASDNASGLAVMLDLAARLKNLSFPEIEFWFVSTGSKEVGAVGMENFIKTYSEEFARDNSYFINFDNLGKGTPHYFLGEGMLNFYKFSKELIAAAEKAAQLKQFRTITPAKYKIAYTDAIIPASKGYHAILMLALDERGLIPNWHWHTDTIENVDMAVSQLTSDFALEMVNNLYEILKGRLKKKMEELNRFQLQMRESGIE
jgi:hypothetical protein